MSGMMLSPKMQRMQRSVRINDGQLIGLAEKAKYDSRMSGYLYKRYSQDLSNYILLKYNIYIDIVAEYYCTHYSNIVTN